MNSLQSCVLGSVMLAVTMGAAHAQSWSATTVRIVVPYPAGTEPDVLARDIGIALSKQTGKTFVVDNKPGANSIIGTDAVAKAEPDGATLLMVDRLALVTNPMLYSKLPYKWEEAVKPVTDLARVNLMIGVRSGLPVKTFTELVAYGKAHPGKLNAGTGGNGHVTHIGMEMLSKAHGYTQTYVPYKGIGPAITGLSAGEVDVVIAGGVALAAQAKSERVRLLAIGDEQRAGFAPEVPTITEAGGKAGSIPSTVFALFAPGKVPDAVITQINQAVVQAVAGSPMKTNYAARGLEVGTSKPADTLASMKQEAVKYEQVIREAGIKIE
ncbi:Bug family tripartite tricarboxylate transporter substrate binding protein [Hydrogenophaga sp. SL48]|uniref:Bug family tripartite tricarboxylate transporter substrate binding protein n=1 Tax=Hydrogenophaga sp. SL48 TaxID=2806347 RepID=UPI001F3BD972|nr:tripartite tricarboxylate transporter substrate binding protein [Hydrogenophaga sp. SL48]UJW82606.1 tripartite tricarboxylate transporter substrate binding protein [Hydrogenophaga sp. SL48]